MKKLKITPIGDRIVLKPDAIKETTDSGILIASQNQEMQTRGVVVAVGKKAEHVSNGDYVMFQHHVATKFLFDDEEFFIFRELDVMAIIEDNDKYINEQIDGEQEDVDCDFKHEFDSPHKLEKKCVVV